MHKVTYLFVRDKHPSGPVTAQAGAPTLADIFDFSLTTPPASQSDLQSTDSVFKKVFTYRQNRFQVLKFGSFNLTAKDEAGRNFGKRKFRIRVMKPTYYSSETASDSAGPGHIYFYVWSNHVTLASGTQMPNPLYRIDTRTSFTDV